MIGGRPVIKSPVIKIVSGGQTGVDRAALDAAREIGLPCGGWVPRGRRAEDGRVPARYPMRETASWKYPQRTRLNVRDSDATLIVSRGAPAGGTALTASFARGAGRPCLVIDLDAETNAALAAARQWLIAHQVRVLNVAGPRESTAPGIAADAFDFLRALLAGETQGG